MDVENILEKKDTVAQMNEEKQGYFGKVCAATCCCFWIPMCGFLAAGNTLETCEQDIGTFLRVYTIYIFIAGPISNTVYTIAACADSRAAFKAVKIVIPAVMFGISTYMLYTGWSYYLESSDEKCYDNSNDELDHPINPRSFLYAFMLLPLVVCGLLCICIPCIVGGMLRESSAVENLN
eukprot:TRINITY_DN22390_c0_g1_i1.p2 TRINITY_DN22390_c0_g1~~TRINITY_DN22390_c0_g1_i1.p2  ORF type:complete len:179 (-),score=28.96 TRINITY_DN22390_c0_g1_i1:206-742(-)